jgi:DNA primase
MPEKKENWVDFKAIKAAVTMQMVLDHYGVKKLTRLKDELRGPCPIHKGTPRGQNFSSNILKNTFKCFSQACGAHGNVLDFVAAMENCTVRDAALKLNEWFKVGDSDPGTVALLADLVAEIEDHNSQIAYHASLVEAKSTAAKKLVASLQKEV